MKQIKKSELRVGDWFGTSPIFTHLTEKGNLQSINTIAEIKKIEGRLIYINSWNIVGKKIDGKGEGIKKGEELFLLEGDELLDIKKQLIMEGLK